MTCCQSNMRRRLPRKFQKGSVISIIQDDRCRYIAKYIITEIGQLSETSHCGQLLPPRLCWLLLNHEWFEVKISKALKSATRLKNYLPKEIVHERNINCFQNETWTVYKLANMMLYAYNCKSWKLLLQVQEHQLPPIFINLFRSQLKKD